MNQQHHNRQNRWQLRDPFDLTTADLVAQEVVRMDNRSRYIEQSRNTRDGARAEIAPRQPLSRGEGATR